MRIAFDTVSVGGGLGPASGGMIVYYSGLLRGLAEHREVSEIVVFTQPWLGRIGVPEHPKLRLAPCRGLPRNRIGRVLYEQAALPLAIARHSPDVLFSACNTTPLLRRAPSVVALHSIQYLFFPEVFSPLRRRYLEEVIPRSLRHADAVITVSEWERREILERFDVDPARTVTVYPALSDAVVAALRAPRPAAPRRERPYVFMASTLYGFKNHERLIRAFAQLVHSDGVPHELVLAGGDADVTAAHLAAVATSERISERVALLGPVDHALVPDLLAGADAVAYTSLCETFGQPILEALAFGRCLVTSTTSSMPEVADGVAILVDPYDVDSIADGLRTALLDDRARAALERAGPPHAATFTWERSAEQSLAVMRLAIESRR
jgi:glycosyltransferase involved in cell wall biosynthesis